MGKVLKLISIVLLGVASAAMFLLWTPLINSQSVADIIRNKEIVVYVLAGLFAVSGLLCVKSLGFKKKKIMRVFIALIIVGVTIAAKKVNIAPISAGDFTIYVQPLILGVGYAFVFLYVFVMHFIEQFKRRGLSKIFAPIADIVLVVIALLLYIHAAVPAITGAPFHSYIEMAEKYAPYVAGGLLAVEFAFALLEFLIIKEAKSE